MESATVYKVAAPLLCVLRVMQQPILPLQVNVRNTAAAVPPCAVHTVRPATQHCRLLLLASNPAAKYVRKIRYLDEEGFGMAASVDMRG